MQAEDIWSFLKVSEIFRPGKGWVQFNCLINQCYWQHRPQKNRRMLGRTNVHYSSIHQCLLGGATCLLAPGPEVVSGRVLALFPLPCFPTKCRRMKICVLGTQIVGVRSSEPSSTNWAAPLWCQDLNSRYYNHQPLPPTIWCSSLSSTSRYQNYDHWLSESGGMALFKIWLFIFSS